MIVSSVRDLWKGAASAVAEKTFIRKFAGGILTQSMISLTNLIMRVWLARALDKSDYGLYVIGFQSIFVFLSLQNALVNSPLAVLLPEKKGEQRTAFLAGLGAGQWLIFLPILLVCAIAGLLYGRAAGWEAILWALPLALAVPAAWLREFQRVVQYNSFQIGWILFMDSIFIFLALSGIGLLQLIGWKSVPGALATLGIAYLCSAVPGLVTGVYPLRFQWAWIRGSFSETWPYSRWALVGVAASNVQLNGYIYIVPLLAGLSVTADLAASHVFMMPFALLVSSSQRIFLAKGANIRTADAVARYRRFFLGFLLFFVAAWVLYTLFLFGFRRTLITLVFTRRYLNIEGYLLLWSVLSLINACRFVITYSLQIHKEFRLLALVGLWSAGAALVLNITLLRLLGPAGVILAQIAGELVLLIGCLPRLLKTLSARERQNGEGR